MREHLRVAPEALLVVDTASIFPVGSDAVKVTGKNETTGSARKAFPAPSVYLLRRNPADEPRNDTLVATHLSRPSLDMQMAASSFSKILF